MNDNSRKDIFFISHLFDLAEHAERYNYPVFTDFMTTKDLSLFIKNVPAFHNVHTMLWGGHPDCDHKMAGFFPMMIQADETMFPIACLQIKAVNVKYAGDIGHRDYLGAILNLGIERSMIGDIRISDEAAYVFSNQEFVPFLLNELQLVRRTSVRCHVIKDINEIPPQEYQILQRSVASPRLDNVVSAMIGSSRGKASELITQGKVMADYEERNSNSYRCRDHTVVTIRGYGKFKLSMDNNNLTKKGKHKITIYKYK